MNIFKKKEILKEEEIMKIVEYVKMRRSISKAVVKVCDENQTDFDMLKK